MAETGTLSVVGCDLPSHEHPDPPWRLQCTVTLCMHKFLIEIRERAKCCILGSRAKCCILGSRAPYRKKAAVDEIRLCKDPECLSQHLY